MSRIWTSPNGCAFVDDDVYIRIELPEPIPEPDFDTLMQRIAQTARNYAVENGGIIGRRYRIDDNEIEYEDNPTVIVDGLQYVTYTGFITVYCQCADGDGHELENDLLMDIREFSGKIVSYEANAIL